MELPRDIKQVFKGTFRRQPYYSALAVSPSDMYAYMIQYNDINSAYQDALRMCQTLLIPGESDCVLYASIVPADYQEKKYYVDQTLDRILSRL